MLADPQYAATDWRPQAKVTRSRIKLKVSDNVALYPWFVARSHRQAPYSYTMCWRAGWRRAVQVWNIRRWALPTHALLTVIAFFTLYSSSAATQHFAASAVKRACRSTGRSQKYAVSA